MLFIAVFLDAAAAFCPAVRSSLRGLPVITFFARDKCEIRYVTKLRILIIIN
jgi:hypothetical protein